MQKNELEVKKQNLERELESVQSVTEETKALFAMENKKIEESFEP
jgi:hypothetical protein